ncbi:CD1375 family protein [Halobacillus karajensis]|nr:CD1375 family protein [Halobacillus karajensis]
MSIAYSYANLIQHGRRTMDDVPDIGTLRQDVQTILNQEDQQM